MTSKTDFRIRDLGQTMLALRTDLSITPRFEGDEPGYLIEDRVNSKFFRIGAPEYTFISLLDGKTSVREALSITAQVEPEYAFTEQQAASICQWLIDRQLATTAESTRTERLVSAAVDQAKNRNAAPTNPWFIRVPIFHPDRLFTRIAPWTTWFFSLPAVILVGLIWLAATYQIFIGWSHFVSSSRGILATDRWIWIGVSWLFIKVVHELGHGIACKRYGGTIHEAGVIFILGAPVAYVDVTSSWRFRSKWQRIFTATAGMYAELLIASVAILVWSQTRSELVADMAFQIAIMASVTTILFNANPLMRFDGYYIASDLLEIPNLYGKGQETLRHFVRTYLWGAPSTLPSFSRSRGSIIVTYGMAAFVWRILVCIGLAVTAAKMLQGAGIILALTGLVMWIGPPTVATIKYFLSGDQSGPPRRLRFMLVTGGLLGAGAAAVFILPWPGNYRAPCVVDYAPSAIVRTASPGFVRDIRVNPSQRVAEGQVLVVMENRQLMLDLADIQLQAQQSSSRMRASLHDGETATYQAERDKHESLLDIQREKQQQVEALTIRAPIAGKVVASDLLSLQGQFLKRGAEVLVIGCETEKKLTLSISQEDMDVFSECLDQPAGIRIPGRGRFVARLTRLDPQARLEPPDIALCAAVGGALPVRPVETAQDESTDTMRYELTAPRFEGTILLDSQCSKSLFAGQRGMVTLDHANRSIANHLTIRLQRWARTLLTTN